MYDYRSRKHSAFTRDVFSIIPTDLRVKTCIIEKRSDGKYQVKREGLTYLQDGPTVRSCLEQLPYGLGSVDIVLDGKDIIVCLRDRTIQVSEYIYIMGDFTETLIFDETADYDFRPIIPHRRTQDQSSSDFATKPVD